MITSFHQHLLLLFPLSLFFFFVKENVDLTQTFGVGKFLRTHYAMCFPGIRIIPKATKIYWRNLHIYFEVFRIQTGRKKNERQRLN